MKRGAHTTWLDEQLVDDFHNGNKNVLGILYNRHYSKVYQICLSITKDNDDAYDLSQDILIKAFSKLGTFKGNSAFSTWLYSIARNHCLSYEAKKRKYYFEPINSDCIMGDYDEYAEEMEKRKATEYLEEQRLLALAQMPLKDRSLLELKYRDNYSIKELQAKYNLSTSAVKMRLMRARLNVELHLEKTHMA